MTRHEPKDDEMREEYVRAAFPDSQSVNEALRVLIKAAQGVKGLRKAS